MGLTLIATPPYVKRTLPSWLTGIPKDPLDIPEHQLGFQISFTAFLLDWLRDRGAVSYQILDGGDFRVTIHEAELKGGITNEIINLNMRRMAYEKDLEQFITSHMDNDMRHILSDIQGLLGTICAQFPETFVNILINKTYAGLSVIPMGEDADYTWDEVHRICPFLWIYIYIQTVLYRYGNLRAIK